MKPALAVLFVGLLAFGAAAPVSRGAEPPRSLNQMMIWTAESAPDVGSVHAGFRREFEITTVPAASALQIFAYTRYQLFINGRYVGRGPNRFENLRPEFDTWDVSARLRPGRNLIAVLVIRDLPNGRVMQHAPGFAARLDLGGGQIIETDEHWRAFVEPAYAPQAKVWSSFRENIDARKSPGEWTSPEFSDAALPFARRVDVTDAAVWPEMHPRSIAMLRETPVPFVPKTTGAAASADGSYAISEGEALRLDLPQISQAYLVLDLDAEAGARVEVTPNLPDRKNYGPSSFTCRAGRQRWIGGDTFGCNAFTIRVTGGTVRVRPVEVVEVIYPFDRVGTFASSDPELDKIWAMSTRSLQLMSEDAYVDCADRERVEWMDCDPPAFDVTRVSMAGPGPNGERVWGDARLLGALLRRTALTQREDGMVKAHTCSERWDIHAIMEDRACDWVEGLRKYHEATGDDELIRELLPRLERLLDWFLARRQPSGLVRAREWVAWDNPMSYAQCEGAANNAFIYRALADGAALAAAVGAKDRSARWAAAARELYSAFNDKLWDESAGAYGAAWGDAEILPAETRFRKSITLRRADGRLEPTLHANLFALDRGLVPPERRARTVAWTLAHTDQIKQIMAQHFFFKLLYQLDEPQHDQAVLDRIRQGWRGMIESPWQTAWEMTGGNGSKCHIYGIVPGFTLPTFVLGVRRDAPVGAKRIVIQPHLGDLTHAQGVVITEFGPVDVSWRRVEQDALAFSFTVPPETTAEVLLPAGAASRVRLQGKEVPSDARGRWRVLQLPPGRYEGVSE